MEYTSAHLRHQLIITIYNHKEFFYPLLIESIKGTYGFPRMDPDEYQRLYDEGLLTDAQVDDHNTPGPFSFLGYLRALQEPDFWIDELCLCLISMCFQIGITVINAEGFTRVKFRLRRDIKDSNMVLCHCKGHHYVPACKYDLYCIWMGHPALRWVCVPSAGFLFCCSHCIQMDACAPGWVQLHSDGCALHSDVDAVILISVSLFSSEAH